jgi:hypothetical protein
VSGSGHLAAGARALGRWRLLALSTAVPVLLGAAAAAPLAPAFSKGLAGTLAGDRILRNDLLAPVHLFDFFRENAAVVAGVRSGTLLHALVALLFQVFFTGGLLAVLGRPGPVPAAAFLAGARRDLPHNARCLLLFLLLLLPALGLWAAALGALFAGLLRGGTPAAVPRLAFFWVAGAGSILVVAVTTLLHDLARAARRRDPRIGAWRAYGAAGRLLRARWRPAAAAFFVWRGGGALAACLLFALCWALRARTPLAIGVLVLLQVATFAARSAGRLAQWGSLVSITDGWPPAVREPPPLPPPIRSGAADPVLEPAHPLPHALERGREGEADTRVRTEGVSGDGGDVRVGQEPLAEHR